MKTEKKKPAASAQKGVLKGKPGDTLGDCKVAISPLCITIAGSDPSGGAGIQLDLSVFRLCGALGMSAITALTAQTASKVLSVSPVSVEQLEEQLSCLFQNYPVAGIKIGILSNDLCSVVISYLRGLSSGVPVVLDPVLESSSGYPFIDKNAIVDFFPHVTLITPNIPEIESMLSLKIGSIADMEEAGVALLERRKELGATLLKGGHLSSDDENVVDILFRRDDDNVIIKQYFSSRKRDSSLKIHGTGCFLSSAITAFLSQGIALEESVRRAREIMEQCYDRVRVLPGETNGMFVI